MLGYYSHIPPDDKIVSNYGIWIKDLILVGPQIRHEIPRIKKFVDASVPVVSMNPSHYGLMNAKGVIVDVKKIMKERK